jgi:putative phosphoribosyl transferase
MFADRREAGRELGQALIHHAGTNAVVLGLPRGGVPVADEVARILGATLDIWVVRKLGAPWDAELGMGAIAEGPAVILDREVLRVVQIDHADLVHVAHREMTELDRRAELFRHGARLPYFDGRTVILVDDGIARGNSMRAAVRGVKKRHPGHLVVAAPVAAPETVAALRGEVDEVVCLHEPPDLEAIALWYEDFRQVPDAQVVRILEDARRRSEESAS